MILNGFFIITVIPPQFSTWWGYSDEQNINILIESDFEIEKLDNEKIKEKIRYHIIEFSKLTKIKEKEIYSFIFAVQ